jgi:hypothetical protein
VLRLLFRFLGIVTLAGAFAAAVIDGARTLADQKLEMTPLGATLGYVLRDKFAALPALVAKINPKLWDPVLLSVLYAPTFLALALIGVVLMILTRARRAPGAIGRRR